MKLSRHGFLRTWDLHAWMGIGLGLVLHVMFFAGAYSLFREDLNVWQDSSLRSSRFGTPQPLAASLAPILDDPSVETADVYVSLPSEEHPALMVQFQRRVAGAAGSEAGGGDDRWESVYVHGPAAGDRAPARSQLATILFYLHFLYHPAVPQGMYVAGVMGVSLLVAIVTGVVIHLKDLARQVHRFRPSGSTRVVWSDAHKVLGVFGLPFQAAFAFTGAMIALGPLLLRPYVGPVFADQAQAERAVWARAEPVPPAGTTAAWLPFERLLERARAEVPGLDPDHVHIRNWRDAAGTVEMYGRVREPFGAGAEVMVAAVDGEVRAVSRPSTETPHSAVQRWIYGIHYAWFGGLPLKVLYAALAIAGCVTILSGNWIWLARTGAADGAGGRHVLARLTAGIGGGLPFAVGVLFAINLVQRVAGVSSPAVEAAGFFGAWAVAAVVALCANVSARTWTWLLVAGGALHLGVAGLDAALVHHGAPAVSSERLPVIAAVNAGLGVAGAVLIGFGGLAFVASRRGEATRVSA